MKLRLLGLLLLTGCTLVDQTTFNPEAGKRPEIARPPPPQAAPDPAALITVRNMQSPELAADVAKAVAAARARKPDVAFDVVELNGGGPGREVGADAAEVARLITGQGVPASRVRLSVRPVPSSAQEVRVYVH